MDDRNGYSIAPPEGKSKYFNITIHAAAEHYVDAILNATRNLGKVVEEYSDYLENKAEKSPI